MTGRALALLLAVVWLPEGAGAQEGCEFVEGSGNLQTVDVAGVGPITYVRTPNLVCRDGVRIRADSAVAYQSSNYVQLIGRVSFEDPDRRLTAQTAEYFSTVGRLQAHQNAELVQKADSSRVRGSEMIYNRADESRARAQLDVSGDRPTARLYVRADSARPGEARSPYDVEADRILIEDDSYFRARGDVRIARDELRAAGDSVEYDEAAGTLRLMSRATMNLDERDLSAENITVELPGDEVRLVVARRNAEVSADDIRLRAPLVRVFFEEGVMERLVAVPLGPAGPGPGDSVSLPAPGAPIPEPTPQLPEEDRARPVATSADFTIVADSLDVLAPGEVLEAIHAVGGSRADSHARDSLNTADTPPLARTDWMEGDTIVANFERVAPDSVGSAAPMPADTAGPEYRIDRLTATGRARSLYRMEPTDSARAGGARIPAIHYVAAASIELEWDAGEVKTMRVEGQTEGVHAEPAPARADSAAAPDSASVQGDAAGAPRPAGGLGVGPDPRGGDGARGTVQVALPTERGGRRGRRRG